MARPLRIEYEGAFYHVIQRGIERRDIFIADSDKQRFLSYFDFAHTGYGAIIHTYILMNNHYHIILETPWGNLSKVMHYLNTSYATYYNAQRKRVGPLYQGRYKAILVEQDEYLHHLSRYIHLNPVRVNLVKDPKEYHWSSYHYFTSPKVKPPRWLNTGFILSMFDDKILQAKRLYKNFVMEAIGDEKDIIRKNTIKGFILGSEEFVENIIDRFIHGEENPEIPIIKDLKQRKEPSLERIKQVVEENVPTNKKLQRKLCLYLSRKYTQKTLNQIADFYGRITDAGVSQAFRRTQNKRKEDNTLNKLLIGLEKHASLLNVET
ncbi:hypothetical protein B9J78_06675 [bacterium Unc6]|nr:hypothetical protein [bacterium Unc6]MBT9131452.1 hypothetical protein [Candidatus Psychracetigena formicireducens]